MKIIFKRLLRFIYQRFFSSMVEAQISESLLHKPLIWGDPSLVSISSMAQINNALLNTSCGRIVIDDHAFFGHNVCLLTGTHDIQKTKEERILAVPNSGRDIIIKGGAWIGSNVTIIGPCTIGEDAVVAAGAVVMSDVKSGVVVGGVPAKLIREIKFD